MKNIKQNIFAIPAWVEYAETSCPNRVREQMPKQYDPFSLIIFLWKPHNHSSFGRREAASLPHFSLLSLLSVTSFFSPFMSWYRFAPSFSTVFLVIFGLVVGWVSLDLDLWSFVSYCQTRASSVGSLSSSVSTDGCRDLSRLPRTSTWPARVREFISLFGEWWPHFSFHPFPSLILSGLRWFLVIFAGERLPFGGAWFPCPGGSHFPPSFDFRLFFYLLLFFMLFEFLLLFIRICWICVGYSLYCSPISGL
jgi:hypothetical protein